MTVEEWADMLDYDEGPCRSSIIDVIRLAAAEEREQCALAARIMPSAHELARKLLEGKFVGVGIETWNAGAATYTMGRADAVEAIRKRGSVVV